ncbi:MAG: tRNA 2-thiouridine(34) synthase MnmA [Methanobacteriota archaeon]|nr:MAG: tRNA 2-thiouridine(34) synthase MnmA [Euryarchaeota archaeon]
MKIAVLLSGGVDSSVALRLLKEAGHDVTAFYLKIWLQEEFSFLGDCPWEEDLKYARGVCKTVDVPLEVVPMQQEYWETIIKYTIDEIKAGRTPNPDMFCNSIIKFGQFLDKIDPMYEKVASGHYARVKEDRGCFRLFRSPDPIKDQTYFLAYLTQKQLGRALFPIGEYTKAQVRELAKKFGLPTQNRRDSQGLCFLGQIKFSDFIKEHLGVLKGDIIDIDRGEKVGEHNGYYYYTIGQRQGLGLAQGPWYVVKKDIENNIIYVSRRNTVREKYRDTFITGDFNWICEPPDTIDELFVKVRHGEKMYRAKIQFIEENRAQVQLNEPDQGIAPGQIAVFYRDQECLGGGIILE